MPIRLTEKENRNIMKAVKLGVEFYSSFAYTKYRSKA